MSGFDFLNQLLGKRHDVNALWKATQMAGLAGRDLSGFTDAEAQHLAECYLKTARFPPESLSADEVRD